MFFFFHAAAAGRCCSTNPRKVPTQKTPP